jgi:protein phosphatase
MTLAAPHGRSRLRIRLAGTTDVGRQRNHNEDSLFVDDKLGLAIVADGMGGHASGEIASQLAIDSVVAHYRATEDEPIPTWPYRMDRQLSLERTRLNLSIRLANLAIHEMSQKEAHCRGMGTTIVVARFFQDQGQHRVLLGHVGDSRLYRIRDTRDRPMHQLTDDHSLLNDYKQMRNLSEEAMENFPHRNVIVRALGMKESVQIDTRCETVAPGDTYLLCSDGLSGMVNDRALYEIVRASSDLDACCNTLVAAANEAGGNDNITVIIARAEPVTAA